MGKHKHSKDKLYIVQSEYRREFVEKRKQEISNNSISHLPFNYCCLSLRPFKKPYCDEYGNMYDESSVLELMATEVYDDKEKEEGKKKKKVDIKNLIKVHFHKHEGKYICPITRKYFNDHSKIVLNKKSGIAYSEEVFHLFKNKKDMCDPITHEPINASDIIVIHNRFEKTDKEKYQLSRKTFQSNKKRKTDGTIQENGTKKNEEKVPISDNDPIENDNDDSENELRMKCAKVSNNKLAQSVTSTISVPTYEQQFEYISEKEVYQMVYEVVVQKKKNSYVRIITTVGFINIELYTSTYPLLCHNFLFLCEYKYYNETEIFKKKKEPVIYLGANNKNLHKVASGFYWRRKLKKKNLRNKLDDESVLAKCKESLEEIKSDQDSDYELKYVKFNDNRYLNKKDTFGNIYFYKCYNKKYANIFYICMDKEYETNDICIGKVVGGFATLDKIDNSYLNDNEEMKLSIKDTIIYTNPFKEAIKELKEKFNKKEPEKVSTEAEEKVTVDEDMEDNTQDKIGKYIDWEKLMKKKEEEKKKMDIKEEQVKKKESEKKPQINIFQKGNIIMKQNNNGNTKSMNFSFW